ncbi:MarR family winged helix-turn-helix transcriptional regulator [Collimonas sp. NPDC087041]|uniref:MarR family winged helix-turn-helix transcriptional regulator n=1 Tax=Collimonas sp. NPDC087041 TaxID=3363960 RepID=UPI0038171DB4
MVASKQDAAALDTLDSLVGQARTAILAALDQELQPLDMTAAQYVIIVKLAGSRSESMAALCKTLSYDPGAMTRMIDRLERKGLVTRLRPLDNRRSVMLELTEAGLRMYPKLTECVAQVIRRFLAGFAQDEVSELKRLLQKLLANA